MSNPSYGLQTKIYANLKLTSNELVYYQDLVKQGVFQDEQQMTKISEDLCSKIPNSVEFFENVLEENSVYFQNVHSKLFFVSNIELTVKQVVCKFLLFWYIIRPFLSIAKYEDRFTVHTFQHAFFEYTSYIESIRIRNQVQQWSSYYSYVNLNFQSYVQQCTQQYELYVNGLKTNFFSEMNQLMDQKNSTEYELKKWQCNFEKLEDELVQAKSQLDLFYVKCNELKSIQMKIESNVNEKESELQLKIKIIFDLEEQLKTLQKKIEGVHSKNIQLTQNLKNAELESSKKESECNKSLKSECLKSKEYQEKCAELKSRVLMLELNSNACNCSKLSTSISTSTNNTISSNTNSNTNTSNTNTINTNTTNLSILNLKEKEIKQLKSEVVKSKKVIAELEEMVLLHSMTQSNLTLKVCSTNDKDLIDSTIQEVKVLVDLCSTLTKSEKIVNVLQNYVVSSFQDLKDEEFPAWLVVAQSILRSIFSDVGLAKG
jgi:hypothetical protein